MTRNVTIKMDDEVLKKCRHIAVDKNMSLSAWIANQLSGVVFEQEAFESARERALKNLDKNYHLGGKKFLRSSVYD